MSLQHVLQKLIAHQEGCTGAHGLRATFEFWPSSGLLTACHALRRTLRWSLSCYFSWPWWTLLLQWMKPKSSLATLFSSVYHKGSVEISEKYSLIHPRNHEMLTATVPFPIKFRNSVRGKQMWLFFFITRQLLPLKYMSGFLTLYRSLLLIKASWGTKAHVNLFFQDKFVSIFLHYIC